MELDCPRQWTAFAIFGLTVSLTSDLLTSKSNQFTFVSNCTEVVCKSAEIHTSGL